MKTVTNAKDFSEAMKNDESTIEIVGDFANKIVRIKATGKLAWAVAGAALGSAIVIYIATPAVTVASAPVAGAGGAISFTGATTIAATAIPILGLPATIAAIAIGVASGGIGAIIKLREKYSIREKSKGRVVLIRK